MMTKYHSITMEQARNRIAFEDMLKVVPQRVDSGLSFPNGMYVRVYRNTDKNFKVSVFDPTMELVAFHNDCVSYIVAAIISRTANI